MVKRYKWKKIGQIKNRVMSSCKLPKDKKFWVRPMIELLGSQILPKTLILFSKHQVLVQQCSRLFNSQELNKV